MDIQQLETLFFQSLNIAMDWAKDLDGKGIPGTVVLTTYINHLKDAGVALPRDWSAE